MPNKVFSLADRDSKVHGEAVSAHRPTLTHTQIRIHETIEVGDLIAAAFDEAGRHSSDSRVVARLATRIVTRLLRKGRKPPALRPTLPTILPARAGRDGKNP